MSMRTEAALRDPRKQKLSDAEFDRSRVDAFNNEGGAPKRDREAAPAKPAERNLAREADHPDAVRAGVRFSARRSGYPNNQLKFD